MYRCIKVSFILLFLCVNGLDAQLNLKVGYGFSYHELEETNKILQAYNAQNPWFDESYKDLHYFQSLALGLRYQWEFVGMELTWQKGFNRKIAEGITPLSEASFKRVLAFNFDRYAIAYENYYQDFGIGASFDYNIYSIKSNTNKEGKQKISNQQNFSSHFYLSYTFSNDSALKFMIKPYVQIPWTQINLEEFAERLNQSTSPSKREENTMSFGLMLIFYQGN